MGAKQSKRSVDISGKEAESAGEVAAAGAGGEGRVEALADADALKPQANGAAHIHEQSDKEKQLDSGTPENEKDATTEKETKEGEEKGEDKEAAPVTNGDAEAKPENGDSSPAPEDGKKPKKEKVKKKWSLRSISFSRKDKPKQEKKQKEEEPKTNGEPEKVPEEAAEVTPENATSEVAEEAKPEAVKEEKTPETPVTEPLTNGSSTPESPKVESPASDEPAAPPAAAAPAPAPAPAPETDRPEPKAEDQPEQLNVNGLSLEEQKSDAPEAQSEESKPEEPAADTTETAPAPEIPVKKEVCVEQMPLESTPPPLPANPPPSSVASFAATTMAPELTDASLANTAKLVISAPPAPPVGDTTLDAPPVPADTTDNDNCTEIAATELPPSLKEIDDAKPAEPEIESLEPQIKQVIETDQTETALVQPEVDQTVIEKVETEIEKVEPVIEKVEPVVEKLEPVVENIEPVGEKVEPVVEKVEPVIDKVEPVVEKVEPEIEKSEPEVLKVEIEAEKAVQETENLESVVEKQEPNILQAQSETNVDKVGDNKVSSIDAAGDIPCPESNVDTFETIKNEVEELPISTKLESPEVAMPPAPIPDDLELPEPAVDSPDNTEDLPPPPPPVVEDIPVVEKFVADKTVIVEENAHETKVNSNHISENIEMNGLNTEQLNGNVDTKQENLKNKTKDSLGNVIEVECNGNAEEKTRPEEAMEVSPSESGKVSPEDLTPPSLSEASEAAPCSDSAPLPPPPAPADLGETAAGDPSQEPIPVSDKLADLIPEVPVVPELNTQTETSSDVAVAN